MLTFRILLLVLIASSRDHSYDHSANNQIYESLIPILLPGMPLYDLIHEVYLDDIVRKIINCPQVTNLEKLTSNSDLLFSHHTHVRKTFSLDEIAFCHTGEAVLLFMSCELMN